MSDKSRLYAIHSDSECERLEKQAALAGLEEHLRFLTGLPAGSVASLRIDRLLYDAMRKFGMNDGDRLQGQPLRA